MRPKKKRSLSANSDVEPRKKLQLPATSVPLSSAILNHSQPTATANSPGTRYVDPGAAVDADPYSTHPLNHNTSQIRVLSLLPDGNRNAALMGKLRVVDLVSEKPKYEALSYVWGSPDLSYELHVQGGLLKISANLFAALVQLRDARAPRDLWIDAICINQTTASEKNHQVGQMFRIYSQAWRVLIWLGEADEESDRAMSCVANRHYYSLGLHQASSIFTRPWWSRVWTLQEGFAAGPYSRVLCGNRTVGWEALLNAYKSQLPISWQLQEGDVAEFVRAYTKHQIWSSTLEGMFWSSTLREATDPRDYIYALLGPIDPTIKTFLQPDYTKPVSWVYQKAMVAMIAEAGQLDLLLIRILQKDSTKPSWYLDFSTTDGLQRRRKIVAKLHKSSPEGAFSSVVRQKPGDPAHLFQHDSDRGTITLVGRKVDEVLLSCRRDEENIWCGLARVNQPHFTCEQHCQFSYFAGKYKQELADLHPDGAPVAEPRRSRVQQSRFRFNYRDDSWLDASRWLFGTAGGRIGFANTSLQRNDIVCELEGALLPIVLRPEAEDTYSVVGVIAASGIWNESSDIGIDVEFLGHLEGRMLDKLGCRDLEAGEERFVIC
ncbi:hypothetical protein EKO04_001001 [Ascochyta lentis]|uniref:Heterokaryon incompatibility domain-containing protein n=1 Tax=Ascochyta lentis TaxID=205686 RepID=A0A8H7MMK3_9PLEO|nr:hypothetical protein EKO04_001001 [Ascochyta lentis]